MGRIRVLGAAVENDYIVDLEVRDMESVMKLAEFGHWCRHAAMFLGHALQPAVVRKGSGDPNITDDEALALDRSLAEIRHSHSRDWRILRSYYVLGLTDHQVAERERLSANRITVLRSGALKAWYYCWQARVNKNTACLY